MTGEPEPTPPAAAELEPKPPATSPAPSSERKRRRGPRLRLWPGLVLLTALGAFVALLPRLTDPELAALDAERDRRLGLHQAGHVLAGTPDLANLPGRLSAHGVTLGAPVMIRIFKQEFELELWMLRDERFHRVATYPVCRWSGRLGPKVREGDRQAPEGFYTVDQRALNPQSRWHRSFNLGYPNALDRAHGRTGSFLMVHGGCSSVGCFAMTDAVVDELWRVVTAALRNGQDRFHVHVYPFRMTEEALAARRGSPWFDFWQTLKQGSDAFEATFLPPRVSVCEGRYRVTAEERPGETDKAISARCGDPTTDARRGA